MAKQQQDSVTIRVPNPLVLEVKRMIAQHRIQEQQEKLISINKQLQSSSSQKEGAIA